MAKRILISWIGRTDLQAGKQRRPDDPGPLVRLLQAEPFDEIHLLNDIFPRPGDSEGLTAAGLAADLRERFPGLAVHLYDADENLRNNYLRAYEFTRDRIRAILRHRGSERFGMLLSSGYPAAQVAMLVAAHTLFPPDQVELFNTFKPADGTRSDGVERVPPGLSLSADVVPSVLGRWSENLQLAYEEEVFADIAGQSAALAAAKRLCGAVARFNLSVLLWGESGTGKELFARAIHAASQRRQRPFVPLNCGGLSESLLESELFGYARGAFTGADRDYEGHLKRADGGTLFLDEVGDMPLAMQVKLLRFLQDGRFLPVGGNREQQADVRVIAATHKDLWQMVGRGEFREDLYYRLNGFTVALPPLRERGRDVERLARRFLEEFNQRYGTDKSLSEEAVALLQRHPWPGNVRELQYVITRAAVLGETQIDGETIRLCLERPQRVMLRPLGALAPDEFFQFLVAVLDETLRRFQDKQHWFPACEEKAGHLIKDVLEPLVFGRAVEMAGGVYDKAGKLFQKSGLDRSNPSDARRLESYEQLFKPHIDSRQVDRLKDTER